jgi:hypothetical protein
MKPFSVTGRRRRKSAGHGPKLAALRLDRLEDRLTPATSAIAFEFQALVHGSSTGPMTSVSQMSGGGALNGATEVFTQDNDFVFIPGTNGADDSGTFTATLVDTYPDGSTETLHDDASIDLVTNQITESLTVVSGTGAFSAAVGQATTHVSSNADGSIVGEVTGAIYLAPK